MDNPTMSSKDVPYLSACLVILSCVATLILSLYCRARAQIRDLRTLCLELGTANVSYQLAARSPAEQPINEPILQCDAAQHSTLPKFRYLSSGTKPTDNNEQSTSDMQTRHILPTNFIPPTSSFPNSDNFIALNPVSETSASLVPTTPFLPGFNILPSVLPSSCSPTDILLPTTIRGSVYKLWTSGQSLRCSTLFRPHSGPGDLDMDCKTLQGPQQASSYNTNVSDHNIAIAKTSSMSAPTMATSNNTTCTLHVDGAYEEMVPDHTKPPPPKFFNSYNTNVSDQNRAIAKPSSMSAPTMTTSSNTTCNNPIYTLHEDDAYEEMVPDHTKPPPPKSFNTNVSDQNKVITKPSMSAPTMATSSNTTCTNPIYTLHVDGTYEEMAPDHTKPPPPKSFKVWEQPPVVSGSESMRACEVTLGSNNTHDTINSIYVPAESLAPDPSSISGSVYSSGTELPP